MDIFYESNFSEQENVIANGIQELMKDSFKDEFAMKKCNYTELKETIFLILNQAFNEKMQNIIIEYYGLKGEKNPVKSISKKYNVTNSWVYAIKKSFCEKLNKIKFKSKINSVFGLEIDCIYDIEVSKLDIATCQFYALRSLGIRTIRELCDASKEQILKARQRGPHFITILEKELYEIGIEKKF